MSARNLEIVRLVRLGHSRAEVARMNGVSRERISKICDKLGLPRNPSTRIREITEAMRDEMVALAQTGLVVAEIARRVGTSCWTVRETLRLRGVDVQKGNDTFGATARDVAMGLVRDGLTYAEAAEATGVSRSSIAGACYRAGLRVDDKSERIRRGRWAYLDTLPPEKRAEVSAMMLSKRKKQRTSQGTLSLGMRADTAVIMNKGVRQVYVEWRNGGLKIGRDWMRGPNSHHVVLAWNNRSSLTGVATPKGEVKAADWIELYWEWPRFRGLRFWRYHMNWRGTERA